MIGARHTLALRYSPLERLIYRLTGRWPKRVVERRLEAWRLDDEDLRTEARP